MEDLYLAIVTMLVFMVIQLGTTTKNKETFELSFTPSIEDVITDGEDKTISDEDIENIIMEIYKSDSYDKRERLIFALDDIAEYIDTSDFMERHPYIHKYIFSSV